MRTTLAPCAKPLSMPFPHSGDFTQKHTKRATQVVQYFARVDFRACAPYRPRRMIRCNIKPRCREGRSRPALANHVKHTPSLGRSNDRFELDIQLVSEPA